MPLRGLEQANKKSQKKKKGITGQTRKSSEEILDGKETG